MAKIETIQNLREKRNMREREAAAKKAQVLKAYDPKAARALTVDEFVKLTQMVNYRE